MAVKLYFFKSGTLKSEKHLFTLNKDIGVPFEVPVPFFLIQHKGENILFDTGNALEVANAPEKHWGDIVNTYFPKMTESEFVENQLKDILNISADEIDYVILSHLHLDHAGGVGIFKNATYIVHEKEYNWAFSPDCNQKAAYIMQDITKEVDWLKINNKFSTAFDLFDDGTIKIYPTPGHTPGHLSVLINLENSRPMFLTSDSCYTEENLNDNIPPGLVWNEAESIQTLEFIKKLQTDNIEIIVGHDPIAWGKFKKAPEFYS